MLDVPLLVGFDSALLFFKDSFVGTLFEKDSRKELSVEVLAGRSLFELPHSVLVLFF